MMPKFFVSMNFAEVKSTTFIIEAENEDDIHDAFSEENFEYSFFEDNCKWVTSEFQPAEIDDVSLIKGKFSDTICTKAQNNKIQKLFNKTIKQLGEAT
jgi:hypothetical protein